jgi:hypothetical protein
MFPLPLIRDSLGAVGRITGLVQHPPQIHDDLDVDVLTVRRGECTDEPMERRRTSDPDVIDYVRTAHPELDPLR